MAQGLPWASKAFQRLPKLRKVFQGSDFFHGFPLEALRGIPGGPKASNSLQGLPTPSRGFRALPSVSGPPCAEESIRLMRIRQGHESYFEDDATMQNVLEECRGCARGGESQG